MSLSPGTRLGPYEITAPIGKGGMGEVYKARDTRLDRIVAVKVLPDELKADDRRRARLENEARAIASLKHPHICTLHDIGSEEGIDFLVLELLEGETLAERLVRGRLSDPELFRIATQIADALARAHRAGVVHRDLKPSNIMLTKDGVKLLDFGLAKEAPVGTPSADSDLATRDRLFTEEGTIAGTLSYMAPEQLEGRDADVRTDLFALGAVLYEMASGRRAFDADTHAKLIARVMHETPPELDSNTLARLKRLIEKCLEKDPDARWQNALDLKTELEWIGTPDPATTTQANRRGWLPAVAASLLTGVLVWIFVSARPIADEPTRRVAVRLPSSLSLERGESPVLSPDGRHLVFSAADDAAENRLWIRSIDDSTPRMLEGTGGASFPFWSPDGRHIAFFAGGYLKRVELSGGEPVLVCSVVNARGGSWNAHGDILFAPLQGPIQRVSADGGDAEAVTRFDLERGEYSHRFPSFLPDGRRFFYAVMSSSETRDLAVGSLDSDEIVYVDGIVASRALYVDTGFVTFLRGNTIMAQRFDVDRLTLSGDAFVLARPVSRSVYAFSDGSFSMARDGTLAYWSSTNASELVWRDRTGRRVSSVGPPARYIQVSLAPDDRTIGATRRDDDAASDDVWILDAARGTPTRLTFAESFSYFEPVWSQDSKSVFYSSTGRAATLVRHDLAQSEGEILVEAAQLGAAPNSTVWAPNSVSFDGRYLIFTDITSGDLWLVTLEAMKVEPLLDSEYLEREGALSPDGRWLAYVSNESGREEIYLHSFPELGIKQRLSTDGGSWPTWRGDGKELYYLEAGRRMNRIMGVAIDARSDSELVLGAPKRLFEAPMAGHPIQRNYDVTSDGERFLIITPYEPDGDPQSINLVLDWDEPVAE